MSTSKQNMQQGAALVSVIVVMLIITALLVTANSILNARLELARQSQQALKDEIAIVSHLSNISYIVATQRSTRVGISQGVSSRGAERTGVDWKYQVIGDELRVDGKEIKIKGINGYSYTFQDEKGLIPVNASNNFWKKRWLDAYNITGLEQNKLLDSLTDYSDADDWKSPAGAEASDYLSNDMPAPTNYLLQTCTELYSVIHWRLLLDTYPETLEQCSLSRRPSVNINAIPERLLELLWPQAAESIVRGRERGRWYANQFEAAASVAEIQTIQDDFVAFNPSNRLIITYYKNKKPFKKLLIERGNGVLAPVTLESLPFNYVSQKK